SPDRRGQNRRYVWNLAFELDPLFGYDVADTKASFDVVSETDTSAFVRSTLDFYFTVNGEKLSTSTNAPFRIAYSNDLMKSVRVDATPTPRVLYPDVVCGSGGLKAGGGAGYFAVDISDPAALEVLGSGLAGSRIYAPQIETG